MFADSAAGVMKPASTYQRVFATLPPELEAVGDNALDADGQWFYFRITGKAASLLKREGKQFPWGKTIAGIIIGLAALGGIAFWAFTKIGYHWVNHWPFMVK